MELTLYLVSMTFSRSTQEVKSMTVGFLESHVKVHFRMNKHGISNYKSSPNTIRMSMRGPSADELQACRELAVEYVKGFTGKDFNQSYMQNNSCDTVNCSHCTSNLCK